jgi:hypothetical protein
MKRMFLAVALALAATPVAQPVLAYESPWCAVYSFGDIAYWDCHYRSFEDCVPHVLGGNRGFCNPNPGYVGRL